MATANVATRPPRPKTHEGAPAARISDAQTLVRRTLACLLWEPTFYEPDGVKSGTEIFDLAVSRPLAEVGALARKARKEMHLRHVPLLLLCAMARRSSEEFKKAKGRSNPGARVVEDAVADVISRADEPAELLAIYRKLNPDGPFPHAIKRGIARSLEKFDAYGFGKYKGNVKDAFKLRDVLRIARPKTTSPERNALYKSIIDGTLPTPDTWEVALSGGADKKETWTRLISDGQLGYMALLRNLHGMHEAGVDPDLVNGAILARKGAWQVLPFRYLAALRAAPYHLKALDTAMQAAVSDLPALPGHTVVLVDISPSMDGVSVFKKSDLTRIDAACALATFIHGDHRVYAFSSKVKEVPAYAGMARIDAIKHAVPSEGTLLGLAVAQVVKENPHSRLIVITDEQSHDRLTTKPGAPSYMINVGNYENGVGYGNGWVNISGFSENIFRYIYEMEREFPEG